MFPIANQWNIILAGNTILYQQYCLKRRNCKSYNGSNISISILKLDTHRGALQRSNLQTNAQIHHAPMVSRMFLLLVGYDLKHHYHTKILTLPILNVSECIHNVYAKLHRSFRMKNSKQTLMFLAET